MTRDDRLDIRPRAVEPVAADGRPQTADRR